MKPYGTTIYTVTASGGTGEIVVSRAVTALSPVTIYGNAGSNSDELVFDVQRIPGAHYQWRRGEAVIPGDTNVITTSADVTTGSPKCYVTVTLGNCSVSDSARITTVADALRLCGVSTVTDHEGNRYNVVAYENTYNVTTTEHNNDLTQCWTKENMRAVTSPSTGSYMIIYQGRYTPTSLTGKAAGWPENDSAILAPKKYGVLYNWNAAFDLYHRGYGELSIDNSAIRNFNFIIDYPRGVCPLGWHVSKSSEWTSIEAPLANRTYSQLEAYTGPRSVNYLGSKLVTGVWTNGTTNCETGDNACSSRNLSDLSILPAGTNNDAYTYQWAYFWTSESSYWLYSNTRYYTYGSCIQFNGTDSGPTHGYDNKKLSMSVRCVKDYDDSYNTTGRPLYYYGYNGSTMTIGVETSPSSSVSRRGVIYSTNASSPLQIVDPSASTLETTDGATVKLDTAADPNADKIFEVLINYASGFRCRMFLIYSNGEIEYSQSYSF